VQCWAVGTENSLLNQPTDGYASRIGKLVVVGQAGLVESLFAKQRFIAQCKQGHRCHTHGGTVAGIPVAVLLAELPLDNVTTDTTAAGGANIDGTAFKPFGKEFHDTNPIPASAFVDCPGNAQTHFRIIGDLAGLEVQPTSTNDLVMHLVPIANLPGQ
jgi:hypothetical protein